MSGVASRGRLAGLACGLALAVAGCASHAAPARDPSVLGAATPAPAGVEETQGADEQAPMPISAGSEIDGSARPPDPHRARRTLGWIGIAIGSEAAIVAVATSVMLLHQKSLVDSHCDNAHDLCSSTGMAAAGAIEEIVPWNTASWIVAGAGLAAGTVLLISSRSESGRATALTVSPDRGGASLSLKGAF